MRVRRALNLVAAFGLWLAALAAVPAGAEQGCPAGLARDLAAEAPACQLVAEGELRSALGNGNVAYRLYRWVSTREGALSSLYDSPPYHNTAAALSLAARPGEPPFWSAYYWLGLAWFETPYLVRHPEYGEILVVPGRYAGTGGFIEDHVFLPNHARGWTQIHASGFDPDTGGGWIEGLKPYLPPGHGIWKGIHVDYATLTGSSAVWRDGDANCCPSGGEIWFRLRVAGPEPRLEVAEAHYTAPQN
jgi:hypothetical protein